MKMKKYSSLAALLVDYRKHNKLSQFDIAAMLDVDKRTVIRWENNMSWIKPEKEKLFVEKLDIPFQVIRNLNSETPISTYFDIGKRTYSLTGISIKASNASWYKSDLTVDTDRIHLISNDTDIEFAQDIQKMNNNPKPLKPNLIKSASQILPDLNLVLHDQSGFYAGHITVLPLKYESYMKLRDGKISEGELALSDLTNNFTTKPLVFYYYSLYADSLDNTSYMMNRLLLHFKQKKYKDYIFAGITYNQRRIKIDLFREMGLKVIWEKPIEEGATENMSFLEGNLDMFLFGKMS